MKPENIHPIDDLLLKSKEKEYLLNQKGNVFWLCGLSGSGKSTLAAKLEDDLHHSGFFSIVIDGDNFRGTVNSDLGFSDIDREENIRRISEVGKLLQSNGIIVIVSAISPRGKFRKQAKEIIGKDYFHEVYINASFDICRKRDVKGLYAKAEQGDLANFTGKESNFEEPINPWLSLKTDNTTITECSKLLYDEVIKKVKI